MRKNLFSRKTKEEALARQRDRCASCGEQLFIFDDAEEEDETLGKAAHAHHMRHRKSNGANGVENCVILCKPCHYSVHEGGNYRFGTVESDENDYPYFRG